MSSKDKHDAPEHAAPIHLPRKHEPDAEMHHEPVAAEPVKAAPPHPLLVKIQKLVEDVAVAAQKHREEVLGLRGKLSDLLTQSQADMHGLPSVSFHSLVTRVEEEINKLDCDNSAKA